MNRDRLSELVEMQQLLHELTQELAMWNAAATVLAENLESLRDEEQQAYEATPNNLKESKRALESVMAISELRSAVGNMDNAVRYIDNALQDISNIFDTE